MPGRRYKEDTLKQFVRFVTASRIIVQLSGLSQIIKRSSMRTPLLLFSALLPDIGAVVAPEMIENLIEWVTSAEHSYWNADKLEIRRADDGDHLGVFAKADILPNELLMQISPERYIHIIGDSLPTDGEEQLYTENYWKNVCKLATKLQVLASTNSNGYLDYLKEQSRGQLPVAWSEAGKERLRHVLPTFNREDVLDWVDTKFSFCDIDDPHWLLMTIQRGFDLVRTG